MYLSNEQRYNIAMKMLSIVEHMAFGRLQQETIITIPRASQQQEDEHDSALNDMIRSQLKTSSSDFMSEGNDELSGQ